MKKTTRNQFLLVLAAFIWGVAFVAQSEGGDVVGAYSFNCVRSLIAVFALTPVISLLDRMGMTPKKPKNKEEKRLLLRGGLLCGLILTLASNLQQLGLNLGTPAGKAGFLTACYIVLVPVIGLFFRKKCGWNVWCGVLLTVAGLYLLCITDRLSLQFSDALLLLCALVFSFHILAIDHFSPLVDGVRMSRLQFLVAGVLSAIPVVVYEIPKTGFHAWLSAFASVSAWGTLLYAGVLSSGVAYTLQIIGQCDVNPTVASLLMSLESVFSVLAGWLILKQYLSIRELSGCLLIFVAVVLSQLDFTGKK